MDLSERIRQAFAGRPKPAETVDLADRTQMDSDVEEAMWFAGREWQEITWHDWKKRYSATAFFSRKAFAYYLPSLLLLSLQNTQECLLAADFLIMDLDRTPTTEGWNDLFIKHFGGLDDEEYEVMKEWLLELCEYPAYRNPNSGPGDTFARAFETLALLQQQRERQ